MKKTILVVLFVVLSGIGISAQSKVGIGINGGIMVPMSDFADQYKTGFGGSASLNFNVTPNLQLSLSGGYSQFSFNSEKFNEILNDFFSAFGSKFNVDIQTKLTIIPIMAGGKYFLTTSEFRPYGEVNLGVHIASADGTIISLNSQPITNIPSVSKTSFAWGLGAGFIYQVSPAVGIDVNAKLNGNSIEMGTSMSSSSSGASASQSSNSTMLFFSASAGLQIAL